MSQEPPVRYVVNARARRVVLRIDPMSRDAVVTAPNPGDLDRAQAYVAEQSAWIRRQLARLPAPQPFVEGAAIPIYGAAHTLVRPGARGAVALLDGPPRLAAPALPDAFGGRVRRFLAAEAKRALSARAAAHAQTLGVAIERITVRDTRSRWGSCSSRGALSFSWRIVCAPPFVIDYLAAHEVAHLREPNHSPRFWALVDALVGDHRPAEAWLDARGPELFALGAER